MAKAFIGALADTADLTTYTFVAAAIGSAAADRWVVVCAAGRAAVNRQVASITIAGVTAPRVVRSALTIQPTAIHALLVPTGTTADIVVTFSNAMVNCVIEVYTLTAVPSANYDQNTADGAAGTASAPTTVNVPEQGYLIACAASGNNGTTTWAGATEDYDAVTETRTYTSASASGLTAATARAVSATFTGNAQNSVCVATWGNLTTLAVTPATLQFDGQDVPMAVSLAATPATLQFDGQDASMSLALTVSPGTLQFDGQDVTFNYSPSLTVDPATLHFAGQTQTMAFTMPAEVAALRLAGQNVVGSLALVVTVAQVQFDGQDVTFVVGPRIEVDAAELAFEGQDVNFQRTYPPSTQVVIL